MDAVHFDTLTRMLSTAGSRRSALGGLASLLGVAEAVAGNKKKRRKKRRKKKQGCPKDSFKCPDGTCVPSSSIGAPANAPTCCHGEPCGECGVCVNGGCVEVVGICDSANCERCSWVHWSCESRCGAGETCVGSRCCTEEKKCGTDCCGFNSVCCNGKCCSYGQICDGGTCKCPSGVLQCGDTCCHAGAVGCEGSRCLNECDLRGDCGG